MQIIMQIIMQIRVSYRGMTNKCWPVSSKGALAGESGGAGKSRKLVYWGRGRVTGYGYDEYCHSRNQLGRVGCGIRPPQK